MTELEKAVKNVLYPWTFLGKPIQITVLGKVGKANEIFTISYSKAEQSILALIQDEKDKLLQPRKELKCEYGHKQIHKCSKGHPVYAHDSISGWCCACEADIAFALNWIKDTPEYQALIQDEVRKAEEELRIKDLSFLEGIKQHFNNNFRDLIGLDYARQKIDDWIEELKAQLLKGKE